MLCYVVVFFPLGHTHLGSSLLFTSEANVMILIPNICYKYKNIINFMNSESIFERRENTPFSIIIKLNNFTHIFKVILAPVLQAADGGIVDNASLISSTTDLSLFLFDVLIQSRSKSPVHTNVYGNNIVFTISEIACYSFLMTTICLKLLHEVLMSMICPSSDLIVSLNFYFQRKKFWTHNKQITNLVEIFTVSSKSSFNFCCKFLNVL